MTLASLLLETANGAPVDKELDSLFRTTALPATSRVATEALPAQSLTPKRKRDAPEKDRKRAKFNSVRSSSPAGSSPKIQQTHAPLAHSQDDTDDESGDQEPPTHISLLKDKKQRSKKTNHAPPDETASQRDARTLFIGNLSVEVAKSKSMRKALLRHLTSSAPAVMVESVRFRSVAFQNPTSQLDEDSDAEESASVKKLRQKERAAHWRDEKGVSREDDKNKKQFLTSSEKKRIAFIKKDFHAEVDTVNAYVVLAYPAPDSTRLDNAEAPLSPTDAAQLIVEKCDGTLFMDRTIRVDRVGQPKDALLNPKRSVFVGNLDFSAKEEDLRVFFESLLSAELGPTADSDDEPSSSWVKSVRLVRDKGTQLGKGFAYVEFRDSHCVDEVLAMGQDKLKFAKRKLRVQKCKSVPGASAKVSSRPHVPPRPARPARHEDKQTTPLLAPKPKPRPDLGAQLASLSKDDRKAVKATDPDRIARRLAKKKARLDLSRQGIDEKKRKRVHKGKADVVMRAKKRIRSDSATLKKNVKK